MNIIWSPTAVSDLEGIRGDIAADSPNAASKIANRIRVSIERLGRFPLSGRSGRVAGTRELVIAGTPFIAVYRVLRDEVQIASVLHGSRLWPEFDD